MGSYPILNKLKLVMMKALIKKMIFQLSNQKNAVICEINVYCNLNHMVAVFNTRLNLFIETCFKISYGF